MSEQISKDEFMKIIDEQLIGLKDKLPSINKEVTEIFAKYDLTLMQTIAYLESYTSALFNLVIGEVKDEKQS